MLFRYFSLVVFSIATATVMTACGGGEQRQVIQNKGSDTLVNVAQAWAEAYQEVNPLSSLPSVAAAPAPASRP